MTSALPTGRSHLWLATGFAVVVVLVVVPAQVLTGRGPDSWVGSLLAFAAWEVAYLALTWRALARTDAGSLGVWAAAVASRPRQRVRDLVLGRPIGFSLPLLAVVYGYAAGLYVLPRAAQLVAVRPGEARAAAAAAVLTAWLALHTAFATHYAYEVARPGGSGLVFPGEEPPDAVDFAYFSFGVGTTFGTTDVAVTTSRLRRIVLAHQLLAFVFNTAVLALVVTQLFT